MIRISEFVFARMTLIKGYGSALSGSAGRLVFSFAYFIVLANTLPIAEFGIFATASAAGVVLSRILAFGFVSPLYRISTVKPRLIGVYSAGFIALALLSLPVVAAAILAVHAMFFARDATLGVVTIIIISEVLLWRVSEIIIIINNGLGRFGRAAILVICGTLFRAAAAIIFAVLGSGALGEWVWFYLGANAISLAIAVRWFYPGHKLRFRSVLYKRRLVDSLAVSCAEIMFYVQMELDKLLVLAFGGPALAGIYAIVMRLVDLTAIPIRAFTMMLVQAVMRTPGLVGKMKIRAGIEAGIFAVSSAALLSLALLLHLYPGLLGNNVAIVSPLIGFAVFVPAFRNLVEYQAELLYARGQTVLRAINLTLLAAAKALLLVALLSAFREPASILIWLNAIFAVLYLISAVLTYTAMRQDTKAI